MIAHIKARKAFKDCFKKYGFNFYTLVLSKSSPNVKNICIETNNEIKRKNNFKDYTFYRKRIKGIKID